MAATRILIRYIDTLSDWSGRTVSWLTLGMVLVTFFVVVMRYLFDTGWIAVQESITYMHALVFLMGAAYTLRHNGHVRVDILYRRFSPRGRAAADLLGSLFLLLPMSSFILWVSWDYVAMSWSLMEGSREAGGLPGVFLLKGAILVMAGLLVLQGIAIMLQRLLVLFGRVEADTEQPGPEV